VYYLKIIELHEINTDVALSRFKSILRMRVVNITMPVYKKQIFTQENIVRPSTYIKYLKGVEITKSLQI